MPNGASEFQKRASTMIALSESPDRWLVEITRRRVSLDNSRGDVFEIATSQTYRTKASSAFLSRFPNKQGTNLALLTVLPALENGGLGQLRYSRTRGLYPRALVH